MQVLAVIDGLGTGGAERSLAEMAAPLRARGVVVAVAYLHRRHGAHEALESEGVELVHLGGGGPLLQAARLRRVIRRRRPDLVHATLVTSSIVARTAAAGTGVPVLTSIVNTRQEGPPSWRRTAVRVLDGWTARHLGDAFHAITETVRADAARHLRLDPQRIDVISRGRSPTRLGAPSAARRDRVRLGRGIPADAELVVAVGRQELQKGHDVLVRSWPAVLGRRPHARLVIAGRAGRGTTAIEAAVRALPAPVAATVTLAGHVGEIGDLLAAADLFVLPSHREGQSGALIEAFAMGLAVVVSDLPALREAVEGGVHGLLVPPGDVGALAEAVVTLLGEPETRSSMGAAARQRFEDRYELARVVDDVAALYRRVAHTS